MEFSVILHKNCGEIGVSTRQNSRKPLGVSNLYKIAGDNLLKKSIAFIRKTVYHIA